MNFIATITKSILCTNLTFGLTIIIVFLQSMDATRFPIFLGKFHEENEWRCNFFRISKSEALPFDFTIPSISPPSPWKISIASCLISDNSLSANRSSAIKKPLSR